MYALRCTCIGLVISLLWVAYIYIVLVVIENHSFGSVILGAIANSAEPFRGLVTHATFQSNCAEGLLFIIIIIIIISSSSSSSSSI